MVTTITCPVNESTGICSLLTETGAGLGVFIGYMGQSLPTLLIVIGVVGGIVAVVFAVAKLISSGIGKSHFK